MARPYSEDLRSRVIGAVEGGMSNRGAAAVFRIGISTVNTWVRRWLETGSAAAKAMGGDHRSRLTGERTWLLERVAAAPDLTVEEIRQELADRGIVVGYATVWRFFAREGMTFKKNRARRRAGASRRGANARGLAGRAKIARSDPTRLHR